jgi:acetylornithine deacetylase/succinyl-diaminopimelate desuccinylase-like protein
VAAEHYGRMYRQVQKGIPVRLELDIRNRFTDETESFNVVADLPGTDPRLKDEVVMIGAHFDSWHNATGATDNGGSSAVMMEAMRILKASGVPLKALRIGLDRRRAGTDRFTAVCGTAFRHCPGSQA